MKRSILIAIVAMSTLFSIATTLATARASEEAGIVPLRTIQDSTAQAQATLNAACATCHDLSAVQPGLYTTAEWEETIDRMLDYGAVLTDEQRAEILAFLATDAPSSDAGAASGGAPAGDTAAQAFLESNCTLCHDLSAVQPDLYTAAEWTDTLNRMIGYGAVLSDDDIKLLVDYLATDSAATGADTGGTAEVDATAAQAFLESNCTLCHDLSAVQPDLYTAAEWTDTLNRMIGYGAVLSDDDIKLLVDYLATDSAATGADTGGTAEVDATAAQAFLESNCTLCHDLSAVQPDLYTAAEWTDTLNRMIGYGASIPEDDFNLLVNYLASDR